MMRYAFGGKAVLVVSVVLLALVLGVVVGARDVPIGEVIQAFAAFDSSNKSHLVIWEARIPRTLSALLIGALVAVSGGLLQGVTRNQLADPGIMGLNSSASLLVLAAAALGASSPIVLAACAFTGAMFGAAALAAMSLNRNLNPLQVAVAGIAIAAGLSSISSFLLIGFPQIADRYRHWALGTLVGTGWTDIELLAPLALAVLGLAMLFARVLNALALGADQSRALGITISRHTALIYLVAALATGVATAFAGPLMFIGLLAPHVARFLVGHDFRASLPLTAIIGGVLFLLADVLGRVALQPAELDAGIVVSIIGAPLVIMVMRRYFK